MELVRPAVAEDRQVCTRLVSQALVAAGTRRGGGALVGDASPATLLERWSRSDGSAALFVGEYEGVVLGVVAVSVGTPAGFRRGLIECCYVEPAARGLGMGSALVDAALGWCSASGCTEVDALALPGDRLVKQRLEAAGFTARLLTLSRRLD